MPPPARDHLLAAIPAGTQQVVVLQVNALLHSPLGRTFVSCVDPFEKLFELIPKLRESGFDPAVDVDRAAFAWDPVHQESIVATGFFGKIRWREVGPIAQPVHLRPGAARDDVLLVDARACWFDCNPLPLVVWRGTVLLTGKTQDSMFASLDRLEDRAASEPFALPDRLATGDIAAVTDAAQIARWLRLDHPPLRDWLRAMPTRAELRVEALRDVRATARITCEDPAALEDLRVLFESAIAAARASVLAEHPFHAEVLGRVAIRSGPGHVTLSVDVPEELLDRMLQACREEAERREQ